MTSLYVSDWSLSVMGTVLAIAQPIVAYVTDYFRNA